MLAGCRAVWIAAIVAAVLAGCGGDDETAGESSTPTATKPAATPEKAFLAKLDAACETSFKLYEQRPKFPLDDFDPTAPSQKQLRILAKYRASFRNEFTDFKRDLLALGEPEQGQARWDALRDALVAQQDAALQLGRDAAAGDAKAYKKTYFKVDRLHQTLASGLLRRVGLPDDSACYRNV